MNEAGEHALRVRGRARAMSLPRPTSNCRTPRTLSCPRASTRSSRRFSTPKSAGLPPIDPNFSAISAILPITPAKPSRDSPSKRSLRTPLIAKENVEDDEPITAAVVPNGPLVVPDSPVVAPDASDSVVIEAHNPEAAASDAKPRSSPEPATHIMPPSSIELEAEEMPPSSPEPKEAVAEKPPTAPASMAATPSMTTPNTSKFASGGTTSAKKKLETLANYKNAVHQMTPYPIIAQRKGEITFEPRQRGGYCFLCGQVDGDELKTCAEGKCPVNYHPACVDKLPPYGYDKSFLYRKGPNKLMCPLHHCANCFNNLYRVRCFNGKVVKCAQCEYAWHEECIPAGSVYAANKQQIICPRHRYFPAEPNQHIGHCADCQKRDDRSMVKCTRCMRSYHFECMQEVDPAVNDTEEFRATAVCVWCTTADYVQMGQPCMGRLPSTAWYPCIVISNEMYPDQKDANLGKLGFVAVQWAVWRNRITYNVIPYNRLIPMSVRDYFFVVDGPDYECYEDWKMLQILAANMSYVAPEPAHCAHGTSNGRKYRIVKSNVYTTAETQKRPKPPDVDVCTCAKGMQNRCGPGSGCLNRQLFVECPKECETLHGGCLNRMIARQEEKQMSVFNTESRGYGLMAEQRFEEEEFIGEYVGEVITKEESDKRVAELERFGVEAQYYIMDYDNGKRFLDAQYMGSNMRFANHSCDPNCKISVVWSGDDLHLMLEAIKKIEIYDEITFDYNMVRVSTRGRGLTGCRCGAPNCSGVMSAKGRKPTPSPRASAERSVNVKPNVAPNARAKATPQSSKSAQRKISFGGSKAKIVKATSSLSQPTATAMKRKISLEPSAQHEAKKRKTSA